MTVPARKNPKALGDGKSVAKKKVYLEFKLQEKMRKNAGQKLVINDEHKEKVIHRKQMLDDILQEYQQISKDKNTLTSEINNMKKHLSYIRAKLDQSMTVLNNNNTLCAMMNAFTHPKSSKSNSEKVKRSKKTKKAETKCPKAAPSSEVN